MEEVRNIAMAYYGTLKDEQKEQVLKYFQSMDKDGDEKIAISEFFNFHRIDNGRRRSSYLKLFKDLDKDEKGYLDFSEFITFYYLKSFTTVVRCDGCGVILNGVVYFTCVPCCHKATSIDLCCSCLSSKNFTHTHKDGVIPVFKDTSSMLLDNLSAKSKQKGAVEAAVAATEVAFKAVELVANISECITM